MGALVNTEVRSVAESSVTVLTAERLLLGMGHFVSMHRGVVGELLEAEITAVGLFPQCGSAREPADLKAV